MKKHLIFKDDKSDKFWNIEVNGKSFTVTYGKTGTAGQTSTKEFDTEEKCMKEAEKLVSEKVKKGYVESDNTIPSSTASSYIKEWEEIVNAKDLPKTLIKHFSYLADSSGYDKVLEAIMSTAISAKIEIPEHHENEILTISFSNKEDLYVYEPAEKPDHTYPVNFIKILLKSRLLRLKRSDLYLGLHTMFEPEWLEDIESELLQYIKPKQLVTPLLHHSDVWLYHPKEKNQYGEPALYFLDHEGGDYSDQQEMNAGSLFLKLTAEKLGIKVEISQGSIAENDNNLETWWNGLDDIWRKILSVEAKVNELVDIKKVLNITSLNIDKSKYQITSLQPIAKLVKLKTLSCKNQNITDLSPLQNLSNLNSIHLNGNKKVQDFSVLGSNKKLEHLDLSDTLVQKINFLSESTLLKRLFLGNTNVSDLEPLKGLKRLETIDLSGTAIQNIDAIKKAKNLFEIKLNRTAVKDLSPLKGMTISCVDVSDTPVQSFEVISSLITLSFFFANNTSLSSLEPLVKLKYMGRLYCHNTPLTIDEIMRYKNLAKPSDSLGLEIYCDFIPDGQTHL